MSLRVEPSKLRKLFQVLKYDPKKGKWKKISEASRVTGLSRPTIYKILEIYPHGLPEERAPRKGLPKYVEDFKQTLVYERILKDYTDPKTGKLKQHGKVLLRMGLALFRMTKEKYGRYIDPATLDLNFFREAWQRPEFRDPETGAIAFHNAVAMRAIISYAGYDLKRYKEFETKGLKRKPRKKTWYLSEDELIRFIYGITEIDTLVFARIGFESGARFSSVIDVSTDKIAWEHNMILMYEPKVKQLEERYFADSTMQFLRQYIRDFNVVGRLFKWGKSKTTRYKVARNRLLKAGLNAGLYRILGKKKDKVIYEGKPTTTHLLKHTFVSLASLHGFGLDDVAEQTGTDPSTLKQYYLGVGKDKLKALILGKYDFIPWHEWIDKVLHPHYQKRYEQLKPLMIQKNGLKMRAKI